LVRRIAVTGATGFIGRNLVADLVARGVDVVAVGRPLDRASLANEFSGVDAVVHLAGVVSSVREHDFSAVNVELTRAVAEAARAAGVRLIHVSSLAAAGPAPPHAPRTEDDPPAPMTAYGRSKLEGEREVARVSEGAAVIVRSAWIYSAGGKNFVLTMLRLMREIESVGVVSDQVGTPTWAHGLAEAIWAIAERPEVRGIHHWTDAGVASWYDVAVAIQEEALALGLLDRAVPVRPIRTADYPTPAARPPYSVLDKTSTWAALGRTPPHWRVSLRLMLEGLRRG
jgi:dTDP-4-dehydrorhamnose reductase